MGDFFAYCGYRLDSHAAGHDQERVRLLHFFDLAPEAGLDQGLLAEKIDYRVTGDFLAGLFQLPLHLQDLRLPSGAARLGASSAPEKEDLCLPFQGAKNFFQGLLLRK
jgi:hypothetical protein